MPQRPPAWKTLAAFATVYLVWGSTFLAIRIGVAEVPPFLLAAMRFLVAGTALCAWMLLRGERSPTPREWASATLLAVLIFVLNYGLVFWAERRVPSGLTAVMMATIPAFMALSEIVILGTQRLTLRLAVGLAIGVAGVAVLTMRSGSLGGAPVDGAGAVALIVGAVAWSVASALARKLPLPSSRMMSSGAQMLAGGALLAVTSTALGEPHAFRPSAVTAEAWLALLYQIVAGSLLAFTAYVWLIHHESPTKVGTYAYVNPVVAVLLGYFVGGEALGRRTILAMVLILTSVLAITTMRAAPAAALAPVKEEA
ncbi:MAG TPA: EamA family transporter [Gemmatimonadales bacterium]|nr:EamA family transporter [Gemmatimonadales bacterium]